MSTVRRFSPRISLLLALATGCERDDFAPALPGLPVPPDPIPARCGDGIENDPLVCLKSSTVGLPFAYEFIRFADFDGDGTGDFFAINTFFEVSWALFFTGGVETGGPQPLVSYEFLNYDFYRSEVLDFDGDGRTDIASAVLHWYFSGDVQTADIRVIAWQNRGGHQFEIVAQRHAEFPPTLAPGDVDGDGRTDLLIMGFRTGATVWAHVPAVDAVDIAFKLDLTSLHLVGDPLLAAADFNGDKHADFALMDGDGRAWQLLGGPDHQLTVRERQSPVVLTPESRTLYAHDLDGDGLDDLIAVRFNPPSNDPFPATISMALARPDGGFTPLATFDTAYPITDACVEICSDVVAHIHLGFLDLDGSGQPALVYAHDQRPELVIHPHIANTLGQAPQTVPLAFPANSLFVDDFEGDGEDAIYVTITDTVEVKPSKENPDGRISTHYLVRHSPNP